MDNVIGTLPSARMSPRIINGVIKWYEGDTFGLQVDIDLTDENGDAVVIQPEDTVQFVFRNNRGETVHNVVAANIENNSVLLDFGAAESAKFPKGVYEYDCFYNGAERKTLAHEAPIVVE